MQRFVTCLYNVLTTYHLQRFNQSDFLSHLITLTTHYTKKVVHQKNIAIGLDPRAFYSALPRYFQLCLPVALIYYLQAPHAENMTKQSKNRDVN